MAAYALTIFIGAFLLFQVQPLMGKYILPWFGGGPGVWTTCMLFFQVLLLGGYAYAHFTTRWLKPRKQAILHLVLLVAALALLPITPNDSWKPHGGGNPSLQILLVLAASLGLPYFVLSSTGPLMQHWFSRARPGVSPYRLYALSNIGSLLALLSYPFYFETHFTRITQATLWAWGLVAYVVCCGLCAVRMWRAEGGTQHEETTATEHAARDTSLNSQPSALNHLFWLLLPACASVLLLATTNKLCQDVAVVPFLWVLPLALYLLSFVICFDSPRWYMRFPFTIALIAAMAGWCWALFYGSDWELAKQVTVYCGGLFICCMVCHGELYRLKPDPRHLTRFYLLIAAGGALGGVFVALAAPVIFTDYYELHWGLFFCGLLFLLVCIADRGRPVAAGILPAVEGGILPPGTVPESRSMSATPSAVPPGRRPAATAQAVPAAAVSTRSGASTATDWRWYACLLPLFIFVGLDWSLVRLAKHSAPFFQTHHFLGLRIGMWAVVASLVVSWIARTRFRNFRHWHFLTCLWLSLGLAGLGATLWMHARESREERVFRSRSFYGVLTVYEHDKRSPESHHFVLQHGRITHGLQFVDPERATWPVSYYGPQSGIALGVGALPPGPRRIGVVGLGTGTMAAFGRAGDYVRIYEINPQVQQVATNWFTYLTRCKGKAEIALGDARLSLEREQPQHFDLIVLDAFSSDAIPVHLLTKEAFEVYERHLNTNGIIAVHVSNHYLDLEPVVVNLARHFGYKMAAIDYDDTENEDDWWLYSSTWILLTRDQRVIDSPAIHAACYTVRTNSIKVPLWTDDFTSLFQVLK
jgi:hypothetical protein